MVNSCSYNYNASHGSIVSYTIGCVLSVILTLVPFCLVIYPTLSKLSTLIIILVCAVIQVMVHLLYFLHLDNTKGQRDNLIALIFTSLVILLMVGLSIWIMFSMHTFMMAK
ncbi:cytochrome o ubiquinol oxidase subunit IV [Candidatus Pseudomonas adelgestsugas]|uniref:Cytochrome bo(3) ubiquinol oxidase subunit 4 n=1 Tax=Candidatus Pseudomonas adelgestsugas TaxID=1302376 RepID=A0ABX5RAF9_9PSED|nr:cytochrome o ubiquinol oxidase subunit IV [Candidatus Pseudomonas adelgestsugas]QAX82274.1 Cytochrome bo(3) ubiquinol oxidase subunit 4 [Candidatus Pseudomonas adelgestsugas]